MKPFRAVGLVLLCMVLAAQGKQTPMTFCCSEKNDLYVTARKSGLSCKRVNTAKLAVENAAVGSVVLML